MMENDRKMMENLTHFYAVFFRKTSIFLTFLLFFMVFLSKPSNYLGFFYKNGEKNTYNYGETLKYRISYGKQNKKSGLLFAGRATFSVAEQTSRNQKTHKIIAYGGTTKFFSLFLRVSHKYESIINNTTLKPVEFKMERREGKYYMADSINFNAEPLNQRANCYDILSTFYKLRTISQKELRSKDTLFFSYYYNNHIINSYMLNLGEEILKTKFGKITTIKCSPLLEKGRIFRKTTGCFVWVTADPMHIPVKLEIPILVGSIYINLHSYKKTLFELGE